MDVEFFDLSYSVRNYFIKGRQKTVLKSVSGKFISGQLCAILGPSGAGKTSLLHVMSGYKTSGITGHLLVNGQPRNENWFRRRSCYITQEDQLPPFMTVEEAMTMAARLKLPGGGRAEGAVIVDEILDYLGLDSSRNTKTEKLSGGQKKRLSIALELLANPPVFFLDEPTSGLDDVAAKLAVKLLSRLAAEGRTVVCTIHQPSASMLKIFDKIYVVAAAKCVYQGTPHALIPFLSKTGFDCPTLYNPADYIIELVDNVINSDQITTLSKAIQNGKRSEDYTLDPPLDLLNSEEKTSSQIVCNIKNDPLYGSWIKLKENSLEGNASYANSGWVQFWVLLQRLLVQSVRNKKALLIQAIHYLLNGFFLGAVFYDNGDDGSMMYNHLKFCVGVVMFFSHTRLFIPIILFPDEIKVAKKEHFNRWYGLFPYYMATMIAQLPVHLFYNFMYISIVYYLSGLPRELWRYVMYVIISNSVALSTEGMGIAIGATFNALNGSVIGPCLTAPFLGLAIYGFDFAKDIGSFMRLLMRTSPMRCGLAAFVIVTFGFGRKPLHCDEIYCHFADPKVLLNYLDGYDSQIYIEMAALGFSILLYRVLAYLSLRKRFAT